MRKRNESQFDPHFPVRLQPEMSDVVIDLDIPEDGLRFDGMVAAVHYPVFARGQFPCLSPEPVGRAVDLDGSPVGPALVAHSPGRVSLTVVGPVHGYFRPNSPDLRRGVVCRTSPCAVPSGTHGSPHWRCSTCPGLGNRCWHTCASSRPGTCCT